MNIASAAIALITLSFGGAASAAEPTPHRVPLTPGLVEGMRVTGGTVTLNPEFWTARMVNGAIELSWKKPKPKPVSGIVCRCTTAGGDGSCAAAVDGQDIHCQSSGGCNCGFDVILIETAP
ncbi:MAG: hypothetical protein ABMB14_32595 [Myxococcota bacterium]